MSDTVVSVGPTSGGQGTATFKATISGAYNAGGSWSPQLPTCQNTHSSLSDNPVTWTALGEKALTVPTGASAIAVIPDYATGTVSLYVYAVTGQQADVLPFTKHPFHCGFASGTTTVYVYASAATTVRVIFY